MHRWLWSLWLLLVLAGAAWAETPCTQVRINNKSSSGGSITVDATAGGITIVEKNTSRCGFVIVNETTNGMRCAPSTGAYAMTVTSTVGATMPTSVYPAFGRSAQEEWRCIRTGGSSPTVTIIEDMP
jgi:hypothetical protein